MTNNTPMWAGPRHVRGSNGVYRLHYDSIDSIVAAAAGPHALVAENVHVADVSEESARVSYTFYNGYTPTSLRSALRKCPQKLLSAVARMRDELVDALPEPVRPRRARRRRLENGDEIDPQRYLQRQSDCWEEMRYVPRSPRVIRIACNMAVLGHREPAELLWRGATAAALADMYSRRGQNVELVAIQSQSAEPAGSRRSKPLITTVTVKSATAPLHLGAAAVALAEVAFYRLVVLRAECRTVPWRVDEGIGRTATLPLAERRQYDVWLDSDVFCRSAALRTIAQQRAQIERSGV